MASEWEEASIGSLAELVTKGTTPTTFGFFFQAAGVPFIKVESISAGGSLLAEKFAYISSEADVALARSRLHVNDVLFTIAGTIGRVALVPAWLGPANTNQAVAIVRPNTRKVLPRFLMYALSDPTFFNHAASRVIQGVQANFSLSELKAGRILLPQLSCQRRICEVLGGIDDRIDLLRQTNTTLEAIAQALFKSWFVDFDPVHARAEGREPEAMDAATAALFPSEFEESQRGLIPKGWRTTTLREAFEINPRRSLRKGESAPYLDMASVPTSGHVPAPPIERKFSSGTKFQNGDTLLARITPCLENGKTAHIDLLDDGQTGWGSTEFIVLRPKAPLTPYFGYLLARQRDFRAFAIQAMTGTSGRQRIGLGQLEQFFLTIPDEAVAAAFGSFVEPIRKAISANADRAATLAALRDTLLPRLISGKLRLPEAKEAAETVLA